MHPASKDDTSAKKIRHWFIFQNEQLLIQRDGDSISILSDESISYFSDSFIRQHQLAEFNNHIFYCAELAGNAAVPPELQTITLRKALELLNVDWYNIAAKAYAIINWDKNHQFCGRCGNITTQQSRAFERICTACSLTFYPRISPSMIVLIHRDDQILMARGHHFSPGAYGLIAGFIEAGERVEDAVHREVAEEVGIKIKNLTYFGSQAWPFPDSLMLGFIAEYDSGELQINPDEIETAGWYRYDQLPGRPSTRISIASKLIDHFVSDMQARSVK